MIIHLKFALLFLQNISLPYIFFCMHAFNSLKINHILESVEIVLRLKCCAIFTNTLELYNKLTPSLFISQSIPKSVTMHLINTCDDRFYILKGQEKFSFSSKNSKLFADGDLALLVSNSSLRGHHSRLVDAN